MCKKIAVYDERTKTFRDLLDDRDDAKHGVIFFERGSLKELEKHYIICGCLLIDNRTFHRYPVDIQSDKVVLPESIYRLFPEALKTILLNYNIKYCGHNVWSSFFVRWQLIDDVVVNESRDGFMQLCYGILTSSTRRKTFLEKEISIYIPGTYDELCEMVKRLLKLSDFNVYNYDYIEAIKYTFHSLKNGYHINFSDDEINFYFRKICEDINKNWEA